jgi:nucleoside-diphosphate-sugar epimerase
MSTSSVKLPVQTMYSRCKKASEEILLSFMEKYKAPISIVRPFTVFGDRDNPVHLIPTLIRSCLTGEPVVLAEEPQHDYIFVDDVVDAIINLSEHHAKGIFEVGSGVQHSNLEVLKVIEEVTGKKANVIGKGETRKYDTSNWVSTNFAARSFGWLPKVSLKEGIERIIHG